MVNVCSKPTRASQFNERTSISRGMRGFTLIELFVAVAVGAIVLAYALPNMRSFMQRNHVVAQSNSVMADMQYARSQAVTTHSYVSVCPLATAGGTTCDTADGNYVNGWMVFASATPGAAYDGAAKDLLRAEAAPSNVMVTSGGAGILTFDNFGQLWVGTTGSGTTFNICALDSSGNAVNTSAVPGTQLMVSISGRVANGSLQAGASCN